MLYIRIPGKFFDEKFIDRNQQKFKNDNDRAAFIPIWQVIRMGILCVGKETNFNFWNSIFRKSSGEVKTSYFFEGVYP